MSSPTRLDQLIQICDRIIHHLDHFTTPEPFISQENTDSSTVCLTIYLSTGQGMFGAEIADKFSARWEDGRILRHPKKEGIKVLNKQKQVIVEKQGRGQDGFKCFVTSKTLHWGKGSCSTIRLCGRL